MKFLSLLSILLIFLSAPTKHIDILVSENGFFIRFPLYNGQILIDFLNEAEIAFNEFGCAFVNWTFYVEDFL